MDSPVSDTARFVRPRHLPGVELVETAYRNRSFPLHSHAEYVIGAIVAGAEALKVRGEAHLLPAGGTLFLQPNEPHANASVGDAQLRYRVLYLPVAAIAGSLGLDPEETGDLPSFPHPARYDTDLFHEVVGAHACLMGDPDALTQESALLRLASLGERSATDRAAATNAHRGVRTAKAYIDSHFRDGFGLADVARASGMSAFHMTRRFKSDVGLSPLAYRNQVRVFEARRLLRAGAQIAEAAAAVGFADQSHLTRQFQRIVGVSPGRYV